MKFKVELDDDAVDEVVRKAMKYWSKKSNYCILGPEDKEENRKVMRAAKVMLDWYGG